MPAAETWPVGVPVPLISSYTYTPAQSVMHTPMDSGSVRSRRRFKNAPFLVSCKLRVNFEELSLFEFFETETINGGADWFLMAVKLATGLEVCEVKLQKRGPRKALSNRKWEVDLQLMVKSLPAIIQVSADALAALDLEAIERGARAAETVV